MPLLWAYTEIRLLEHYRRKWRTGCILRVLVAASGLRHRRYVHKCGNEQANGHTGQLSTLHVTLESRSLYELTKSLLLRPRYGSGVL